MILLVAVYAVGRCIMAQTVIDLGPFNLQPSNLAKIAFILWLAHYLSRPQEELRRAGVSIHFGLHFAAVYFGVEEPDLGSAFGFPCHQPGDDVCGRSAPSSIGRAGGGAVSWRSWGGADPVRAAEFKILESYQSERVLSYFGRGKKGLDYNVEQALISVVPGD